MSRRDDNNRAVKNAKKFATETVGEFKSKPILIIACVVVVFIVFSFIF